jgi:type I restriction enzyme S subunit
LTPSAFCRGFDITKNQQTEGLVPVVSSGGIKSYHSVAKVDAPGVIVGRKGTLGLVHYLEVPYWPHDTTLWVKDFHGNDPRFAAYFCDHLDFARYNSGGINPTLNRNTVHAEVVAYPTRDEQTKIGDILRRVEAKGQISERCAATLRSLFSTLLHQLMTAQIRVHDLDISALDSDRNQIVEHAADLAGVT